jgi:hypothetical protein
MSLKTSIDSLVANVNAFIAQLGSLNGAVQQAQNSAADAAQSAADAVAVVTGGTASLTPSPGKIPLGDANGLIDAKWLQDVGFARRALAQAIETTYASTGSTGISVPDSAHLDFGPGNFTIVLEVALPDWTPTGETAIVSKYNANVGFSLSANTNGTLKPYLNAIALGNSAAHGFADGSMHQIVMVVVREAAAVAGSLTFYCDGIQLGAPIAIPAGSPASVDTASMLYLLGHAAARNAGTLKQFLAYNCALSAAEVLYLYRNGVSFADKWGSQTAQYTSNFTAGVDGWGAVHGVAAGNIDAIGGLNDWLSLTVDSGAGTHYIAKAVLTQYKRYKLSCKVYIPSSSAVVDRVLVVAGGVLTIGSITTKDAVVDFSAEFTNVDVASLYFYASSASGDSYTGNGTDVIYIRDIVLTEIGATLALEPEGIQPNQWHDSSANDLHASYPSVGASLARFKETGQYNWTTPITGDTTLTGIVPAGYELDKIVFLNSTANAVSVRLGTTAGGADVFGLTALNTSATLGGFKTILCNQAFSKTAARTLYLSSTAWSSASLTATFYFRRLS